MNNIKAAFFDFDWTLFDHKTRTLIDSAVESIKEIRSKGVKVFINSARSYFSLDSLNTFKKIQFDGYVVTNGGACILEDETIYAHCLNKKTVKDVIKICEENDISYLLSTLKTSYIYQGRNRENVNKFYEVFYEGFPKQISEYNDEDIIAIQIFTTQSQDHLFEGITGILKNRFFEYCIEFTAKEFVKSEGITSIINKLNISPDEICAFGDDVNDIDMFKLVKYGICMGNGKDEAKKHAYHITTNIEDDGIRNGLKFLGLID